MARFKIQSVLYDLDDFVEYENCQTAEEAKIRWVSQVREELGEATARTMRRQVKVTRVDEDNGNTRAIE